MKIQHCWWKRNNTKHGIRGIALQKPWLNICHRPVKNLSLTNDLSFALAFITQDQNSVVMPASLTQQLQYEWQVEMVKKLHVRKNDPYGSSNPIQQVKNVALSFHTVTRCHSLKDIIKRTKCHKCWELAERSLTLGVSFAMKTFVIVNSCRIFTGSYHCATFIATSIEKLTRPCTPDPFGADILFFLFFFFFFFFFWGV